MDAPSGPGSRASHEAAKASSPEASIPSALTARIPSHATWWTGTGAKLSSAQIIAPLVRRHSFYATAATEEEALRKAVEELEEFMAR